MERLGWRQRYDICEDQSALAGPDRGKPRFLPFAAVPFCAGLILGAGSPSEPLLDLDPVPGGSQSSSPFVWPFWQTG